jgi:hypothetical protein
MDREELIVNLKLLESIQKQQKLTVRDVYLNVEPSSIIPECIRRWKRQDGRDTTIKKINEIVNNSIDMIKSGNDISLKDYLTKSCIGISNLKDTYSTCKQTCARLDTILDKIQILNTDIVYEKGTNY